MLMNIANSFDFRLFISNIQVPTQYADNPNDSNLVINLMFLWDNFLEINNYSILSNLYSFLDHTPLTVDIIIEEEFI